MGKQDEARELLAVLAQRDLKRFATDALSVRVNSAQDRWYDLLASFRPDGSWSFRRVVHWASNQVGKTLGLAIAVLWAAHIKAGTPVGDYDYWLGSPYKWIHLGPTHPTALKMLNDDMIRLLEGSHVAQEGRPAKYPRELWKPMVFEGQYPGLKLWNGAEIHFRTTDDRAKGISALVANGISVDEAALEPRLLETLDTTVKMRTIATGGPVWIVSTPDGINDFHTLVMDTREQGTEVRPRIWTNEERQTALIHSIITDNEGYGLTHEQIEFMEHDLDPAIREVKLRGAFLEPSDAFFTPMEAVLKAWVKGLREDEPRPGHHYVIFWDVSVASDPTVMVVLDVTRNPWRGVKFQRWERPMPIESLLQAMVEEHHHWSSLPAGGVGFAPRAITGYDATSMGGVMLRQSLRSVFPQRPVNFGGPKMKLKTLTNLRAALSTNRLWLPESWLVAQREVLNYRLDDKRIQQDSVMALAGAAHIASLGFGQSYRRPFNVGFPVGLEMGYEAVVD